MVADPETMPGQGVRHGTSAPLDDQWWVECVDPFGRCRAMNVVVHEGRVKVVAPPGESAVLSADQTRLLGTALAKAADRAPG